jgi:branched-chain amino acid transport system permease protein
VGLVETLFSGQLLAAAIATSVMFALVALGLNLVYGTMRLLNVAHGDLVMLGGYGAYWLFTLLGLSPLLALFVTGAGGGLLAMFVYRGLFRRVLGTGAAPVRLEANSLLMFFGLSIIIQNLVAYLFSATPRGYSYLADVYTFDDVSLTGNRIAAALVATVVLSSVLFFLRVHPLGLSLRALIERREAAVVVGVNVDGIQNMSFIVGFASAAVAGTLVSMTEQVTPFMGFPFTIAAFVVIIMGGLGHIGGGVVAAFILGAIETYGVALTSSTYRSVLLYAVFVGVLLLRPQGLFNRNRPIR